MYRRQGLGWVGPVVQVTPLVRPLLTLAPVPIARAPAGGVTPVARSGGGSIAPPQPLRIGPVIKGMSAGVMQRAPQPASLPPVPPPATPAVTQPGQPVQMVSNPSVIGNTMAPGFAAPVALADPAQAPAGDAPSWLMPVGIGIALLLLLRHH